MNKHNNVQDLCRFALIALLCPFVLGGCAGEVRHDGSKTYTLGQNENVTSSYASQGDAQTKTYSSQQDGVTYTVGKYDGATAHYTIRPGELPPPQFKNVQHEASSVPVQSQQVEDEKEDVRIVLELSDVLFDFDKWIIKDPYYIDLDRWADYLLNNPQVMAEIQGHTDSTGPAAYNQTLSLKRAKTVINYLRGKGVAANRLAVKGYGESRPKVSNSSKEGQQKNRRVEMHY